MIRYEGSPTVVVPENVGHVARLQLVGTLPSGNLVYRCPACEWRVRIAKPPANLSDLLVCKGDGHLWFVELPATTEFRNWYFNNFQDTLRTSFQHDFVTGNGSGTVVPKSHRVKVGTVLVNMGIISPEAKKSTWGMGTYPRKGRPRKDSEWARDKDQREEVVFGRGFPWRNNQSKVLDIIELYFLAGWNEKDILEQRPQYGSVGSIKQTIWRIRQHVQKLRDAGTLPPEKAAIGQVVIEDDKPDDKDVRKLSKGHAPEEIAYILGDDVGHVRPEVKREKSKAAHNRAVKRFLAGRE